MNTVNVVPDLCPGLGPGLGPGVYHTVSDVLCTGCDAVSR